MEVNASGQVLCQTCGMSCGGKPVHWDAEKEAIVCSDCYGEGDSEGAGDRGVGDSGEGDNGGGIESDNVMEANAEGMHAPSISDVVAFLLKKRAGGGRLFVRKVGVIVTNEPLLTPPPSPPPPLQGGGDSEPPPSAAHEWGSLHERRAPSMDSDMPRPSHPTRKACIALNRSSIIRVRCVTAPHAHRQC
jgi:hypothetical protein